MNRRRRLSPASGTGRAALLAAIVLLLGVALVLFANRPIPSAGAVSYAGRQSTPGAERSWEFSQVGVLPAGVVVVDGGWTVRAEGDAPSPPGAVCQTTGGPTGVMPIDFLLMDKRFPLLALGDVVAGDLAMEAQFKLLSGQVDRAAGIAFRVRDQANYYVVRANGLESNVNLYKFVDGRRSIIQEAGAEVPSGVWQTLVVEARGSRIRWALDGRPLGEAADATHRSGGVGLWTKADSVTCFDDVRARAP